jgi:hypothetical protein
MKTLTIALLAACVSLPACSAPVEPFPTAPGSFKLEPPPAQAVPVFEDTAPAFHDSFHVNLSAAPHFLADPAPDMRTLLEVVMRPAPADFWPFIGPEPVNASASERMPAVPSAVPVEYSIPRPLSRPVRFPLLC